MRRTHLGLYVGSIARADVGWSWLVLVSLFVDDATK
jgi:hypothetical protein